jgi:hypothetical protein
MGSKIGRVVAAVAVAVLLLAGCTAAGSADTRGKSAKPAATTAAEKLTATHGDGVWNIEQEMQLGLWETPVIPGKPCVMIVWANDSRSAARIKLTGGTGQKLRVRLLPDDFWFQTDRCGAWERVAP